MSKEKIEKTGKQLVINYIKLIVLYIVVVGIVISLCMIYTKSENYKLTIPVIRDSINIEINSNEIYNYIRENENALIYIGVADSKKCREFEEDFNVIVKNKRLENDITYLNLTEETARKSFIKDFNKFYNTNVEKYPALILFRDGKVKEELSGKRLTIDNAKVLIATSEIGNY